MRLAREGGGVAGAEPPQRGQRKPAAGGLERGGDFPPAFVI